MNTMMHSCVSLDFIEKNGYNPVWFNIRKGRSLLTSRDMVRQEVERFRGEGLTWWPTCDSLRPDGHCAGHPTTPEQSAALAQAQATAMLPKGAK